MATVLMGAVVTNNVVTATLRVTVFGSTKVSVKNSGWPQAVIDAGNALMAVCNAGAEGLGNVTQVQIYTPITDPTGYPGFTNPGELLDLTLVNAPMTNLRVGDDEVVPDELATARDALKAAIAAAI